MNNYLVNQIVSTDSSKSSLDVITSSGVVRGQTLHILNKNVNQYLNIPFAEPPVGRLRFAKPEPLKVPKTDIIDGTKLGNSCIQSTEPGFEEIFGGLALNEDCLVLNVWSPNGNNANTGDNNQLKPVMFWIYGGGLSMGSIFQNIYNASALAASGDVVIVAANYRLGTLDFLYGADNSAPGNVGLYDQLLALKWVRDNVHAFGGDRDQITIFGESAGSWSVSAHILSPLSRGLFRRAIMHSGSVMFKKDRPIIDTVEALEKAKHRTSQLGCDPYGYHLLDCLRNITDPTVFMNPSTNDMTVSLVYPVIGTEFLPQLPQKAFELGQVNTDIDLMAGTTTHEGLAMALMWFPETITGKQFTEDLFGTIVDKFNQMFHNLDKDSLIKHYLSNITNDNDNVVQAMRIALGDLFGDILMALALDASIIHHGCDIEFIFGIPLLKPIGYSELDYDFSLHVMQLITNFAKYGKPDNEWPQLLDNSIDNAIKVRVLTRVVENPFASTCDGVWNNYF
ncbi:cholinesterase-like [Oppia nitens]|uniref:cholinesterase-like n=1 Tax=Oppia nitens TaxID=1686743 RepID=UPI0023D9F865|nr:cholinesterase-like [Oppia nitens]